jgi:hypothetical protein
MLAEYVSISCTQTGHIIVAITVKDPQDMLAEYVSISCTQTEHIIVAITVKDPQDMLAEYVSVSCTQTGHINAVIKVKDSQDMLAEYFSIFGTQNCPHCDELHSQIYTGKVCNLWTDIFLKRIIIGTLYSRVKIF